MSGMQGCVLIFELIRSDPHRYNFLEKHNSQMTLGMLCSQQNLPCK